MDLFNKGKVSDLEFEVMQAQNDLTKANTQIETVARELQEVKDLNVNVIAAVRNTFEQSRNFVNKNIAQYPSWTTQKAGEKYCTMDDIYSIIRRLVGASLTVPMYPYFEKNQAKVKELKAFPIGGNIFHQKSLQIKALEDLPETDPVYKLLANPSMYQNAIEFWEEAFSYLYIFGRVPIIKMRSEFGANTGKPVFLEVLIPNCLIPKVSTAFPKDYVVGYDYIVNGITLMADIDPDDIIMVKYFHPLTSTSSLSPMEVLKKRATRMDANMDNSVAQMQNGGVPGIVFNKNGDGSEVGTAGQHKDNFYRYVQNKNNKGAPYWAGDEDLGYIQLGLKLADLDAANIADIDFDKACNVWGISSVLFNNKKANTESNVKEMRKALYTDATLPNVFRFAAALESSLNKDFTDKRRIIQADISDIPELQQDAQTLATWLNTAWWVTPNEKREMMKFDRLTEPMFDKPIVPTGLVALEDLQGSEDLPVTEDYNKP